MAGVEVDQGIYRRLALPIACQEDVNRLGEAPAEPPDVLSLYGVLFVESAHIKFALPNPTQHE